MKKQDNKQRLFEVMGKIDPTFKQRLNEYDNYNYPPGADADPSAPWHQNDPDQYDHWDIELENGNPSLYLRSESGGKYEIDWEKIFGVDNDAEADAVWDDLINAKEIPELNDKIENAVNTYLDSLNNEIDWEDDEPDDNPDNFDESSNLGEQENQSEEEGWEEQVESYINGNVTFFANFIKRLDTGTLIRFLRWAQENNIKF